MWNWIKMLIQTVSYGFIGMVKKVLSSVSLWIWITILVCKIKYGKDFINDEVFMLVTLAVLSKRTFENYLSSKFSPAEKNTTTASGNIKVSESDGLE